LKESDKTCQEIVTPNEEKSINLISKSFDKVSVAIQLRFDEPIVSKDLEDYTKNLKLSIKEDSKTTELEIKKTELLENNETLMIYTELIDIYKEATLIVDSKHNPFIFRMKDDPTVVYSKLPITLPDINFFSTSID